ncbi:MAG: YraN family protein [Candidatus Brennerbacteria bacterium]|nr:YraN family protein [Candidatus Brennerbacteria bacterium]
MITKNAELGTHGESAACLFLERKGYKIIDRNVRYPWGELDVVTQAPDGTLVFVEVKTMTEPPANARGSGLRPEDHMTGEKMEKFRRTASLYAGHRHELVRDDRGYRLDLVALVRTAGGFAVRHYENV